MRKVFYHSILVGAFVLMLTGCRQQSLSRTVTQPTFSEPSATFKKQEEALISWGYQIKQRHEPMPTKWEQETFKLQGKKSIFVKHKTPMPEEANTYYRFTLTEESYPDEMRAKHRLENLFQKPPDFDEQERYSFGLRKGYRHHRFVYVIETDALLFEKELQRLARELEKVLSEK